MLQQPNVVYLPCENSSWVFRVGVENGRKGFRNWAEGKRQRKGENFGDDLLATSRTTAAFTINSLLKFDNGDSVLVIYSYLVIGNCRCADWIVWCCSCWCYWCFGKKILYYCKNGMLYCEVGFVTVPSVSALQYMQMVIVEVVACVICVVSCTYMFSVRI